MEIRSSMIIIAAALVFSGLVTQASMAKDPVRYTVRVEEPSSGIYKVAAEFPATGDDTYLSLPSWTPGHYTLENYARHVGRFEAVDAEDGRALRWDKTDADSWRVVSSGTSRIRVSFEFSADTLNLSGSLLHDDFGFFNGTNLFLYPETGYDFESEVTFELPEGWLIATELQETKLPNVYTAIDYHELVDNPTFLGHFAIDSTLADGIWVRLAVYPGSYMREPARTMALDALEKIAESLHELFGDPPYDRYTTLIYLAEGIPYLAGLEHSNSHFDVLPTVAFEQPRLLFTGFIYRLLSHEYYHAWNVKRIRPAGMWPYAYDRQQFTPLLWVSEGITDYYAQLILVRTGIWPGALLWRSFEDAIGNVESQPVHEAVEDASLNTWIDPTFIPQDYYYDKGALLGLLLDIRIRDATDNRHSLDDVMARLYREHFLEGSGFTTEDFIGYVAEYVGEEASWSFYRDYVDGRRPLPFQQTLALAGLRFESDTITEPFLGVAVTATRDGGTRITTVQPGSAAARAGLQPGDILESVGEVAVTDEDWGSQFREVYTGAEGMRVPVKYERDGQPESSWTTIGSRTRYVHRIQPERGASPGQLRIREGLLTGETEAG